MMMIDDDVYFDYYLVQVNWNRRIYINNRLCKSAASFNYFQVQFSLSVHSKLCSQLHMSNSRPNELSRPKDTWWTRNLGQRPTWGRAAP